VALAPAGALDHFLIGLGYYWRGAWDEARSAFRRVLDVQPGHFWAQFYLAVCDLKLRHGEAARVGLNVCLSLKPDFAWAYLYRGLASEQLQAPAEAQADFQRALQLNPNTEARYVLLLSRGVLHFNQRDWEHAAADFRSALALKPEEYHAYLNLAHVALAQGQLEEAEELMRTAQRWHAPIRVLVGYHVERAWHLLRNQKYADVLQACEIARQLLPEEPAPWEVQGRALLALGRFQEAEESFDEHLRKGGEEKPDVFQGRGQARMKLGKYPEAVEDYSRALEPAPDASLYQHLGWAHFFADAWKLALHDFSRALALDPEMGDAYTGRGLSRVMLGDHRGAVADAEAAWRRRPGTPEMMHNIACIFAQAMVRAESDPEVEDRQALVRGYRSRALEAVRQTLTLVDPKDRPAFWQDRILADAALAPIRHAEELQQLQGVRP
jgi:tetratricopeptide (TPR) repeat protein